MVYQVLSLIDTGIRQCSFDFALYFFLHSVHNKNIYLHIRMQVLDVLTYLIYICFALRKQIDYFYFINDKIIETENTKAHLYLSHLFVTALVWFLLSFL